MKDMKKILIGLSMCIVCFACTTKQDVIDGGVSSPYYDGTIMEYLRSNTEQWGYTVQMIERAGLTDLFEGRVDTVPTMTFFAPPSFAVYRYLMDCKYKGVTEDRYESIEDMPVELCRELILKHVVVGKYLKENIGLRNMDYAIHAKEQDGGTTFTCIGKNQVIAYLERNTYKGIPEAGAIEMFLYSVTVGKMIPLATPNIQPKNGVVHALNYGYDFGKI